MYYEAPLGAMPDIYHPSNPEKTPWYFLFLQETVSYSTIFGGFIFPLIGAGFLVSLPFLNQGSAKGGIWFRGMSKKKVVAWFIVAILAFILSEGLFMLTALGPWLEKRPPIYRDLLNPAAVVTLLSVVVFAATKRKTRDAGTAVLFTMIIIVTAVIGLTFMGWLRGPNWILRLPFEVKGHV
jgi:hypothetical protein